MRIRIVVTVATCLNVLNVSWCLDLFNVLPGHITGASPVQSRNKEVHWHLCNLRYVNLGSLVLTSQPIFIELLEAVCQPVHSPVLLGLYAVGLLARLINEVPTNDWVSHLLNFLQVFFPVRAVDRVNAFLLELH